MYQRELGMDVSLKRDIIGYCMVKELILKVKVWWSFKMSGITHSVTQCHIPAAVKLQQDCCANLGAYKLQIARFLGNDIPLPCDNSYSETSICCCHMCHFSTIIFHLFCSAEVPPDKQCVIILDVSFCRLLFFSHSELLVMSHRIPEMILS